jgi:hypothetical protein
MAAMLLCKRHAVGHTVMGHAHAALVMARAQGMRNAALIVKGVRYPIASVVKTEAPGSKR